MGPGTNYSNKKVIHSNILNIPAFLLQQSSNKINIPKIPPASYSKFTFLISIPIKFFNKPN